MVKNFILSLVILFSLCGFAKLLLHYATSNPHYYIAGGLVLFGLIISTYISRKLFIK